MLFQPVYCTIMTLAITLVLPLLYCTLLKWGGGVCSNIQLVLYIHPTNHPVPCDVTHKDKNHDDFRDFLEEWQLCQSVLRKFNATLVLTLSQETFSGEIGRHCISSYCKQQKALQCMTKRRSYSNFVCTYL